MKMGVWTSDFFLNHWDWLRGCANLGLEEIRPVEVLLLQNWRKTLCFSSPHVRRPEKASIDQVVIWSLYPSSKIYIKCWNRKKIGTWDVADIAKRCVKHHPFRHCPSRFFTSDDDLQCALYMYTVHCTVQDFNVNIATRRKVGTIPCRTMRWLSRAGAQCAIGKLHAIRDGRGTVRGTRALHG